MTIRAAKGTMAAVCDATGPVALQVQQASDVHAALSAARLARVDITGLGATVSPAVSAPGGPLLLIEVPAARRARRQIPQLVLDRLGEFGVESALVAAVPTGGRLDTLESVPHAVILRVFPGAAAPTTVIPAAWLDLAGEWVAAGASAGRLRTRVLTVERDVPVETIHDVLHECLQARAWCDAVAGNIDETVRTATLMFGRLPHLVLAAAGPAIDRAGLLLGFDALRDLAGDLRPGVAYACLDFEPTLEGLAFGLPEDGWRRLGGAPPNDVAAAAVDERAPDVFPYQVLAPGHAERLSGAGVRPPAVPLGDGRVGVALGAPENWLRTGVHRDAVHAEAAELLAPLLVTDAEMVALLARRSRRAPTPVAPAPADGSDLDSVVLEPAPHAYRGTRLTVLELAAALDHDAHTDRPRSVSPVIAAFVRWWAAGVDDGYRQGLRELAGRLPGTAGDDDAEHRRRWAVADWLVRQHTPRWLSLVGLFDTAEELAAIGPLTDHAHVVRAAELLGRAAVRANRRFDITASLATDDAEAHADRQAAWEAWEEVADAAGWSAASEAATDGIPGALVDAANLCAVDAARAAATTGVAEAVWTAALEAVAGDAWDRGWHAADLVTRDLTGFTIRVEMGRVAKASLRDLADDEQLEVAERAATRALTEGVLHRPLGSGGHPWDEARRAARHSAGGASWAIVVDEVERLLGEHAWAEAMDEARAAVDEALGHAPDMVARAVVVAVAREASGAAARSAALRAVAVARADGAGEEASVKAATGALAATADELRHLAHGLVESLVSHPRGRAPRR